jgi:uncharacterized damage-inducible protein DinB
METAMPGPLVSALIAHFDSSFEGPNGDYPSVLEAIAGLTARQAAWKPSPQANSIWQIVDHLATSNQWQIDMLETGRADSPVWIVPGADEAAWQALVARLKDTHARLKLSLERVSDDQLLEHPSPELRQTLLELILSSGSAHEAHHGGQISYLRGLQEQM